jgi:hypothetical protein
MFERTDSVLNNESLVPQKFLTNPSKPRIYPCKNSYCDHRKFDNVNQVSETKMQLHTILQVLSLKTAQCNLVFIL